LVSCERHHQDFECPLSVDAVGGHQNTFSLLDQGARCRSSCHTAGDVGLQRLSDVDVEPAGADDGADIVENAITDDYYPMGAPSGVDDAMPAAEGLTAQHPLQRISDPLAVVGMFVRA